MVDGKLYSFGGFDAQKPCCTPTDRAYVYNAGANTWSPIAPLPDLPTVDGSGTLPGGVTHAGVATDGDVIYFAGGYTASEAGTGQIFSTENVWYYSPEDDSYTFLPDLPAPRAAGGLVYLDNALHFFGGTNLARTEDTDEHWVLDLGDLDAGWSAAAPLPNPRNHLGHVAYGGKVYAVGGQHDHDGEAVPQDDVHAYDPQADTWTQLADMPVGVNHITASTLVAEGHIITLGGKTGHTSDVDNVQAYDPQTDTWAQLTPLPQERSSGVAGYTDGSLYYSTGNGQASTYAGELALMNAPEDVVARINTGGSAVTAGDVSWSADQYFTGGKQYTNPEVTSIAGTDSDEIYLTEHSATESLGSFSYGIPVPEDGTYTVKLHFAEIYWGATGGGAGGEGQRVFSVNLEGGDAALEDYDINADVGPMTAVVKTFQVPVSDGTLNIDFNASVDQPKVSAIEVLGPQGTGSALPSPWLSQDIGAVGATGSAGYAGGTFTVEGSGVDIWDAADEFRFVYQPLSGDGAITARVISQTNTDEWAKAGVMIRESLDAGSKHAMTVLTPENGVHFQYREQTGSMTTDAVGTDGAAPVWVRLMRAGNTLTGYVSDNGSDWQEVGSMTVSMGQEVYVGLAVSSHNDGQLSTAAFDNVEVSGTLDGAPEIVIENLDGVPFPDRLVFHRHQTDPDNQNPSVHDVVTLHISNAGTGVLEVAGLPITGPFELADNITLPATVAPGGQLDVPVQFTGVGSGSNEIMKGTLTVASDDEGEPSIEVDLAGIWQQRPEGGQEPNVAEIVEAYGYGTTIVSPGQEINNDGRIETIGDEVLSPYWKQTNTSEPVTVRQLAAFHSCCSSTATVYWHPEGSNATQAIFTHAGVDAQTLMPRLNGNLDQPAYGEFSPSASTFGFKVDPEWSDPSKNNKGPDDCSAGDDTCGHHVRFWPAKDQAGDLIPDTFIMVMDYSGINYDFNDNVYLISNIEPAENTPPRVAQPVGNVTMETGGSVKAVDLSDTFSDLENDVLTLSVQENSNPDLVTASLSGTLLMLTPAQSESGTTDITIRATDLEGEFIDETFEVTVSGFAAEACGALSALACDEVPVSLPFSLTFDGSEGGLSGEGGAGTGFTMVDPPSARLAEDGTPTYANVPGYEPGLLAVSDGALAIETTPGIFYKEPSTSTETNSQINALGVGIDASSETVVIETALSDLPGGLQNNSYQQAGLWFGLGEASYAKLVVIHMNDNDYKVQLGYELDEMSDPATHERNTANDVLQDGDDVLLRLEVDPIAQTATAFYSTNGGVTYTQVEGGAGPLQIDASLFEGVALPEGSADLVSFAGVLATHRRAETSNTFAFESFDVQGDSAPVADFEVKINFQDEETDPPAGYLKDFGQPYGERTGADQGDGEYTYGWIDPDTDSPTDLTNAGRSRTGSGQTDLLKATVIHMNHPTPDTYNSGYWELAVPNGTYEVTVTAGDPAVGQDPEVHHVNAEGVNIIDDFEPSGPEGSSTRHTTGSGVATVSDGKLTLDYAGGGVNTKLNAVVVQSTDAQNRPSVAQTDPDNGATDVPLDVFVAVDVNLPTVGGSIDTGTLSSSAVKLYPTGNPAAQVPANLNDTGGGDAIILQPIDPLASYTQYTFEITDELKDLNGAAFIPYTMSFTTGANSSDDGGNTIVEFEQTELESGERYTSLTIGPDGRFYALAEDGRIMRWDIEPDGMLSGKETLTALQDAEGGNRLAIGLAFDPSATADNLIAWVSHTTYGYSGMPNWGGKITRLSGPNLSTMQDYIEGLPRSTRDHVTNSLAFGPDGALYVNQGSMSAMGAPDNAWGQRPENKMSAAVLRIDLDALEAQGNLPLDVQAADGGTYDPYDANAPVKLFATGIRNMYDLVWHSNGNLYVPTNGSAAGGNAPASQPGAERPDGLFYNGQDVPALNNISKQDDYLFRVPAPIDGPGGEIQGTDGWSWNYRYYGHPNPTRGEYVLNGGNPTFGADPAEVGEYPVGTDPDSDWEGFAYDFGPNKSPNGVIEYQSNTFGGALKGKLLVVRFSGGDDVIVLTPGGTDGDIVDATTSIPGLGGFDDPLDLTENPATGDLYVATYDRDNSSSPKLVLVRPVGAGAETPAIAATADELIFSGTKNATSDAQTVTLLNEGTASLEIQDIELLGNDNAAFAIVSGPSSTTLAPGQDATLEVAFAPNGTVGPLNAALRITSNDPLTSTLDVGLYGLSANGLEGGNEPPLSDVVQTLGYTIDVGWSSLTSDPQNFPVGEEAETSLFEKAGSGNVTMTPVARYSPAEELPFGYYTGGGTLNQVGVLSDGEGTSPPQHQTLFPKLTSGSTSFDPGDQMFGFYTTSNVFGHTRYTEDDLNSDSFHATRVYPLKDRQGQPVLNSYLIGFEDASNGDYQDYVFVVSNVQPAGTEDPPVVAEAVRINVGGEAYTGADGQSWSADQYVTGSSEVSSKDFDVEGTEDDELYLTYRYASNPDNQGPGADFGLAIPVEEGFYTIRLHFLEPYFGAPNGGDGGTGQRVFDVDVEGGQGVIGDFDLNAEVGGGTPLIETFSGVNVTDGTLNVDFTSEINNAIISAVEVLPEEPPVAACSPYSTLECGDIPVGLPFALAFDGTEGGLEDGSFTGTGFTMVDPPSARLDVDGTPTYSEAPGYEPDKLSVSSGQLTIASTPGIQYAQNAGIGTASSDVNSQINALGVGLDASDGPITIQTTIANLDFSVSGGTSSQQAGLWFGLDEDNYVKFVVAKDGNDSGALELAVEDKASDGSELVFTSSKDVTGPAAISALSSKTLTLVMELDPAAGEATASYSVDGGTAEAFVTLPVPARFFVGLDHDSEVSTEPVSFAGIFATHRRATEPIDVAFNGFSIDGPASAPGTFELPLAGGWNLVGLPLEADDPSFQAVFPTASEGTLYSYDGVYEASSSLEPGHGYWAKFEQGTTQAIKGDQITQLDVEVQEGWNLVAGLSCSVPRSAVGGSEILSSTPFYSYGGTYEASPALEPGRGYWVKAEGAGTLVLDCGATALAQAMRIAPPNPAGSGFGSLAVRDAGGRTQELFFGAELDRAEDSEYFLLPPKAPAGGFDARFVGGSGLLLEESKGFISVQTSQYPVRITLEEVPEAAPSSEYVLEELSGERVVATHTLSAGSPVELTDPSVTRVRLINAADLPREFALKGNYPNPFRSATSIAFDAPEEAEVRVEVFNVLGQRILTLPAEKVSSGAGREIRIDASSLSSGVYFYRMTVEMMSETITKQGRMMVVK